MMKRLLLSGAALSVMATFAIAQTAVPAPNNTPPDTMPNAQNGMAPISAAPAADRATEAAQAADPNLYSNIQGSDVVDDQDKSLGRVADLILDSSGELRQVIIGHGGLIGIGETLRAFDATELPRVADGKVKLGALTTASLETLPEFAYPEAETGRAATTAETPAGAPAGTVAPGGNIPGGSNMAANTDAVPTTSTAPKPVTGSEMWPASYLVGSSITNAQDKAAINDLRFEGNRVIAVLVDKGSLGLGADVAQVKFSDLQIAGTPKAPEISLKPGTPGVSVEGATPPAK